MSKKPLKATDRRRNIVNKHGVKSPEGGDSGAGEPLADLFNDRRKTQGHGHHNGHGKKAF